MKKLKYTWIAILVILIAVSLGVKFYVAPDAVASEKSHAMAKPQATPVEATIIQPQSIEIWKSFSGHVVAVDRADIRPQVSGRINEIHFEDGQHVEKGDVLIVIDPRPYEAALNLAKAALDVAKTDVEHTKKEHARAVKLIETDAISQSLLDERANNMRSAAATLQGAKAQVESAKINLDYAYVKAPIAGKISRAEITEGNLVQTGASAPLLTSIVSDEKFYVDFEVDERTYLSSVKTSTSNNTENLPVRLSLLDGEIELQGYVHSFDNRIDQATGTIRARAIFNNESGLLLPGMSVSIRMGAAGNQEKIMITERAIGTDQDRKFVYIVGEDSTAQYREVKIGASVNGTRVVLSGLTPGDTVITSGLIRIRPGVPVAPQIQNATISADKATDTEAMNEDISDTVASDVDHSAETPTTDTQE